MLRGRDGVKVKRFASAPEFRYPFGSLTPSRARVSFKVLRMSVHANNAGARTRVTRSDRHPDRAGRVPRAHTAVSVATVTVALRPRLNGKPPWHAQPEPLRDGYGADSAVLMCVFSVHHTS